MLCRIGTLQIQPRTHVVDHSDYAAPTRQPELLSIMQVRNISALLKDVDHQVDNRRNVRRVELLQLLFGGGGGGGGGGSDSGLVGRFPVGRLSRRQTFLYLLRGHTCTFCVEFVATRSNRRCLIAAIAMPMFRACLVACPLGALRVTANRQIVDSNHPCDARHARLPFRRHADGCSLLQLG